MAPPWLAPRLPRLPPILHNTYQNPTPSYSKGPRGLSVLLQQTSIFTRTSISPGLMPRQCSSRYTFRAGRNLPDKGFRYLRTVIVTAAVHRGFGSKLLPTEVRITSFLNLPALGRYQPLYLSFRFGRDLCLCYTVAWAGFVPPLLQRAPFFQSYGVKLPSSLTRVLSNTLGYLPPSTSGGLRYGHLYFSQRGFSGQCELG